MLRKWDTQLDVQIHFPSSAYKNLILQNLKNKEAHMLQKWKTLMKCYLSTESMWQPQRETVWQDMKPNIWSSIELTEPEKPLTWDPGELWELI